MMGRHETERRTEGQEERRGGINVFYVFECAADGELSIGHISLTHGNTYTVI